MSPSHRFYLSILYFFLVFQFDLSFSMDTIEVPKPEEILNNSSVLTEFEGLPSALVAGCVNVITGDYQETEVDLTLPGAFPLELTRHYSSSNKRKGTLMQGWNIGHGGKLLFSKKTRHEYAVVKGCGRGEMLYKGDKHDGDLDIDDELFKKGLTNCGAGELSGKTHIKNHRLRRDKTVINLMTGAGDRYTFWADTNDHENDRKNDIRSYMLRQLSQPNGNALLYNYHHPLGIVKRIIAVDKRNDPTQKLSSIQVKNLPSLERFEQFPVLEYDANDGLCPVL